MFSWVSGTLLVVALAASVLAIAKDVLPQVPTWFAYVTAAVTLSAAVLQFIQDYRGRNIGTSVAVLAEGVSANTSAPTKTLTSEDQRLYASLKEDSKRFREAKIKLFFSPSLDAGALYRLGLLAFNQRDPIEAEKNLKYALELDPTYTDAFNLLLQLYQSQAMNRLQGGDYESARQYLEEAQRLVAETDIDGDIRTVTLLGYAHKSFGQVYERSDRAAAERHWDEAGRIFERALARAPDDPNILNGIGNVLHHRGEFSKALANHEAALATAPNYTAAANDAAIVCEALMKQDPEQAATWKDKACNYWQQALALSVHDPQFNDSYRAQIRAHSSALCR